MHKEAYQAGVVQALVDAGLLKTAKGYTGPGDPGAGKAGNRALRAIDMGMAQAGFQTGTPQPGAGAAAQSILNTARRVTPKRTPK